MANGVVVHNCNYSAGKFGKELTFIEPFFWKDNEVEYQEWLDSCREDEARYLRRMARGVPPQQARADLPNCLKTVVNMKCNLREWRHVFGMRCPSSAHPQMVQSAKPVFQLFRATYPELYDDLDENGQAPVDLAKATDAQLMAELEKREAQIMARMNVKHGGPA